MPESMEASRKEQIFAIACEMMRKNGYQGTSMRDIAGALQMEAASLYNHISGKEEILKQTCFTMAEKFSLGIAEVNDIYFNAAEKLAMAVRKHILILTQNMDASWVFMHEWRNLSDDSRLAFISLRDSYEREFAKILKNGEEEGIFNEVDIKFAVLTILSSINWVVEWYKPNGKMSAKDIADKLTDFILTGLKK